MNANVGEIPIGIDQMVHEMCGHLCDIHRQYTLVTEDARRETIHIDHTIVVIAMLEKSLRVSPVAYRTKLDLVTTIEIITVRGSI